MELVGAEKRIQVLFCELALEDQSYTPQFESMWHQAQADAAFSTVRGSKWPGMTVTAGRLLPQRGLNMHSGERRLGLSLAAITIALVLAVLVLWARSGEHSEPQRRLAANSTNETSSSEGGGEWVVFTPAKPGSHKGVERRRKRASAKVTIVEKAATISSWRSPTALFMESPADPLLKSLPQLNQSVKEMESFLPNK